MSKAKEASYKSPSSGVPPVGTVLRLKGKPKTPPNLLVVVDNETLVSESYDGNYYFHGITCIKYSDLLELTPDPKEFVFNFPRSSWALGTPMSDWEEIETAMSVYELRVVKKTVVTYCLEKA